MEVVVAVEPDDYIVARRADDQVVARGPDDGGPLAVTGERLPCVLQDVITAAATDTAATISAEGRGSWPTSMSSSSQSRMRSAGRRGSRGAAGRMPGAGRRAVSRRAARRRPRRSRRGGASRAASADLPVSVSLVRGSSSVISGLLSLVADRRGTPVRLRTYGGVRDLFRRFQVGELTLTYASAFPRRARLVRSLSHPLAPEGRGKGMMIARLAGALADALRHPPRSDQRARRRSSHGHDQRRIEQPQLPLAPLSAERALGRGRRPVATAETACPGKTGSAPRSRRWRRTRRLPCAASV